MKDARDKLSEALGERLELRDVIDLVNEARQNLWLDVAEFTTLEKPYKLECPS